MSPTQKRRRTLTPGHIFRRGPTIRWLSREECGSLRMKKSIEEEDGLSSPTVKESGRYVGTVPATPVSNSIPCPECWQNE